jgi:ribose 5-phosphate isomerase B
MRIAIGSDHRGTRYKKLIKERLTRLGHCVSDLGAHNEESTDYPDYAQAVARAVADGQCDRGVLICSSGIGMSIAANRFKGVRAALCLNAEMARISRFHNNSNVLCLGQDAAGEAEVNKIVDVWLSTGFEGGRHQRRIDKMDKD